MMKKIHIIGSVGSGKTTLARNLSANLKLPHYELDNVVWKRCQTSDVRRSEKERDQFLQSLINSDAWIIEGVHYEWVQASFENADVILLLDSPYRIRTFRIIKRFILQKLGIEKSNYKPTFTMFRKMFVWNRDFEDKNRQEIMTLLSEFGDKVIIITDNTEIEKIYKMGA